MMTIVILFIHMPNVRDGNNTNFDSIERYWNRRHIKKNNKIIEQFFAKHKSYKTIMNSNCEQNVYLFHDIYLFGEEMKIAKF